MADDLGREKLGFTRLNLRVTRLVSAAVLGLAVAAGPAVSKQSGAAETAGSVRVEQLPREGQAVYRLIGQGGPFRYGKDGSTFGNRERLLPAKARGYYREYTVETPGSRDRGARRIVCGGDAPKSPDACYYTDDHYGSFRRIVN